jgi:hypothetical protein
MFDSETYVSLRQSPSRRQLVEGLEEAILGFTVESEYLSQLSSSSSSES